MRANRADALQDEIEKLKAELATLRAQLTQALAPAQPARRERRPLHAEEGWKPSALSAILFGAQRATPAPHEVPYQPAEPEPEQRATGPGALPSKFFRGGA